MRRCTQAHRQWTVTSHACHEKLLQQLRLLLLLLLSLIALPACFIVDSQHMCFRVVVSNQEYKCLVAALDTCAEQQVCELLCTHTLLFQLLTANLCGGTVRVPQTASGEGCCW